VNQELPGGKGSLILSGRRIPGTVLKSGRGGEFDSAGGFLNRPRFETDSRSRGELECPGRKEQSTEGGYAIDGEGSPLPG